MQLSRIGRRPSRKRQAVDNVASVAKVWSEWQLAKRASKGVAKGTKTAGKAWVAWPPAGAFPIQAYNVRSNTNLTDTGWSLQSEDIALTGATVTVTSGGTTLAVDVAPLEGNYGGARAIRIRPDGWEPAAGQTYSVAVSGISTPIQYEMQMIDCAN